VEAKYMRLRQLTGELRGKDMEVGRLLEDKMRILAEILEEQGVQPPPLPPLRYTLLVQEREKSLTKEELLQVSSTNFFFFQRNFLLLKIYRANISAVRHRNSLISAIPCHSVADPDPHRVGKLDPDPHQSEKV
jgi:hypothetical protein